MWWNGWYKSRKKFFHSVSTENCAILLHKFCSVPIWITIRELGREFSYTMSCVTFCDCWRFCFPLPQTSNLVPRLWSMPVCSNDPNATLRMCQFPSHWHGAESVAFHSLKFIPHNLHISRSFLVGLLVTSLAGVLFCALCCVALLFCAFLFSPHTEFHAFLAWIALLVPPWFGLGKSKQFTWKGNAESLLCLVFMD